MTRSTPPEVADRLVPLAPPDDDPLDAVLEALGDARFVLLGEASHGTEEFYALRARLTRRLVAERGFDAVAVEADWPDATRVSRYLSGRGKDPDAERALAGFQRFPTWMWRNTQVLRLVEDLRGSGAGFYGLDLYSFGASIEAVLRHLDRVDPDAAAQARRRYGCFGDADRWSPDAGWRAAFGAGEACEEAVVAQLAEMCRRAAEAAGDEDAFVAAQNAVVVRDAQRYYRLAYRAGTSSWNLRDTHMADTLDALDGHLSQRRSRPARIVVWAHNSHLGDARATDAALSGEIDLGQLVRERHPGQSVVVGFTTYDGTVTAADDWGTPGRVHRVRPALPGSVEELLHETGVPHFLLDLRDADGALREDRLQRFIGVVYRPQTERASHYRRVRLAEQFDLVVHVDRSRALEPLDRGAHWTADEPAEAWPTGL